MTDERIIAYLLKELPEEEAEQFEEQCFQQESWPDQVNLVEEELIHDYLRGELASEQRRHFERNYLTTAARHERVRMVDALLRHVDVCHAAATVPVKPREQTWLERLRAFWSSQTPVLRACAVLASLVIIVGSWWFFRPHPFAPKTFAALTLSASTGNRAEGVPAGKVSLPLNADALRIILTLPAGATPNTRYRGELENIHGDKEPLEIEGQQAQSVSVVIPVAQLTRGQYVLKLFAVKDDSAEQRLGSYFFSVE